MKGETICNAGPLTVAKFKWYFIKKCSDGLCDFEVWLMALLVCLLTGRSVHLLYKVNSETNP